MLEMQSLKITSRAGAGPKSTRAPWDCQNAVLFVYTLLAIGLFVQSSSWIYRDHEAVYANIKSINSTLASYTAVEHNNAPVNQNVLRQISNLTSTAIFSSTIQPTKPWLACMLANTITGFILSLLFIATAALTLLPSIPAAPSACYSAVVTLWLIPGFFYHLDPLLQLWRHKYVDVVEAQEQCRTIAFCYLAAVGWCLLWAWIPWRPAKVTCWKEEEVEVEVNGVKRSEVREREYYVTEHYEIKFEPVTEGRRRWPCGVDAV